MVPLCEECSDGNDMLSSWEETIHEVRSFSDSATTASQWASDRSTDAPDASVEVHETTDDIAAGMAVQNRHIQSATEESTRFSGTVEEAVSTADEVADIASRAAAVTDRTDGVADVLSTVAERVDRLETEALRLDDRLGEFEVSAAEDHTTTPVGD